MVKPHNPKPVRQHTAARKQRLLEEITAYVDAHLAEHVTLKQMAARGGVGVSTITQMFQNMGDSTFHQYLTDRRMEAATHLIQTGTPLEDVGKQVGYQDHSSFYRAFVQHFGCSPRDFKRKLNRD